MSAQELSAKEWNGEVSINRNRLRKIMVTLGLYWMCLIKMKSYVADSIDAKMSMVWKKYLYKKAELKKVRCRIYWTIES